MNKENIPDHICPNCYREKPNHASDCSLSKIDEDKIHTEDDKVPEDETFDTQRTEISQSLLSSIGTDDEGNLTKQARRAQIADKIRSAMKNKDELEDSGEKYIRERKHLPGFEKFQILRPRGFDTIKFFEVEVEDVLRIIAGRDDKLDTLLIRSADLRDEIFDQDLEISSDYDNMKLVVSERLTILEEKIKTQEQLIGLIKMRLKFLEPELDNSGILVGGDPLNDNAKKDLKANNKDDEIIQIPDELIKGILLPQLAYDRERAYLPGYNKFKLIKGQWFEATYFFTDTPQFISIQKEAKKDKKLTNLITKARDKIDPLDQQINEILDAYDQKESVDKFDRDIVDQNLTEFEKLITSIEARFNVIKPNNKFRGTTT